MIGNDIVDIKKARSEGAWKRSRFIKKIFAESERPQILGSGSPFLNIWRMWSMKESVYKVIVQSEKERFLNPQKLVCSLKNEQVGFVEYEGEVYATQSHMTNNFIYSSHTTAKQEDVIDEILNVKDPNDQRMMVRLALFQRVSDMFEYPIHKLSVRKNEKGVPKLYNNEAPLPLQLSLTHHGNYAAYAINALKGERMALEWRQDF